MAFFEGSSDVTIHDGQFSSVSGSQYNYHVQGNLVMEQPRLGELGSNVLNQYQELKAGQVYLKRKIAKCEVLNWDTGRWRRLDAHRTIHVATIGDGEREFLHISYGGPDAIQAYQKDLEIFANVKDINYTQLFGYIKWNAFPALIFYDALVPVSHIFERNSFSCLLQTYLCYAAITQGLDAQTLFRELWVNPRNSMFHKGPYVADSSDLHYRVQTRSTLAAPDSDHPSLDLQTYNNTGVLFEFLIGVLPIRSIIYGICWSYRITPEWPNDQDTKFILSSLPGMIYHRTTLEIIAQYPGDRAGWCYRPWKEKFCVPDAMQESSLVTDDGSVRFMPNPADIASLDSLYLCYDLLPWEVWNFCADAWVSQAHSIFSQLGIAEGEWREYSVLDQFYLEFECEPDEEGSHLHIDILTSTPVYLFIRPVPRPFDDENEWSAWLGGKKYYWSSDPSGKEEMTRDEQLRLGLPSYTTFIKVWHIWWDRDSYDSIHMVNRHEGFGPTSLELAGSLGHTILEVVGGNTRFEELKDNTDRPKRSIFKKGMRWVKTKCFGHFRSRRVKAPSAGLLLSP